MRKHVTDQSPDVSKTLRWLDLEQLAAVEVTSEHPARPIEGALLASPSTGWQASSPGEQAVRLRFDAPQQIRRLRLLFEDAESSRTQEFVLRYLRHGETQYREVLRQQFTFSPAGATREQEEYAVDLADVVALELRIVPNITGGPDRATLSEWRVGF